MNEEFGTPIPPIEEPQGGKNNRTWIIIIVVLVVLCCCCLVVALLFYFVLGDPLLQYIEDYSWMPLLLASI